MASIDCVIVRRASEFDGRGRVSARGYRGSRRNVGAPPDGLAHMART